MEPTIQQDEFNLTAKMMIDTKLRKACTRRSHYWFFNVYFCRHVAYKTAEFQKEMFAMTQQDVSDILVVVSFRGSAKSTVFSMSYPIWSIVGILQKKFVVLIAQTQEQARQLLKNIRNELENNTMLRNDLGPFQEEQDGWNSGSLFIPKYNAKIAVVSVEQSIRGIRHHEHRPDLIILDDVEDLNSVKTKESREKTYQWFIGDIASLGDKNTRIVVIGNLLHKDSLTMRLKENIEKGSLSGNYKEYPLIDGGGNILWPGKYPAMKDVEKEKMKIGDEIAWQREYLLHLIPSHSQIVHPEWIQYYDKLPSGIEWFKSYPVTAVDLAISQKETADYTAAVSAWVYFYNGKKYIFILPNPLNERLDFPATVERLKSISYNIGEGYPSTLIVESVGYQMSMVQQLEKDGHEVKVFHPGTSDKATRLSLTTAMIHQGYVKFPRHGAEQLIEQMVGFGIEKHDDLVDAFSMLIVEEMKTPTSTPPTIMFV